MKREQLSEIICNIEDRQVAEAFRFDPRLCGRSPERTVHMKKRIITFVLAAVLMLALGISAYAVWGTPRWTATHDMENTGDYTSLADLSKVEKITGYDICLTDSFSNGFAFSKMHVGGEAVYDENYNVLKEYYGVYATYKNPEGSEFLLSLSPVLDLPGSQGPRPGGTGCIIGDTEVRIYRDHYKFVPEDYEKTDEDIEAEAGGNFFISFGADDAEEKDVVSADFILKDVTYSFYFDNAAEVSDDMIIRMVSELIGSAGA